MFFQRLGKQMSPVVAARCAEKVIIRLRRFDGGLE
jgi:hypothetical protein